MSCELRKKVPQPHRAPQGARGAALWLPPTPPLPSPPPPRPPRSPTPR
nr:MAG TPA_asm: hypothetical protein [Caudoviricetes sp.]